MTLSKKIDFAVILHVKNANPNGDPLNGNRPRTTLDGHGEISDVCIKRKIRDRLMEGGFPIFVQSSDKRNDLHCSLKTRAEAVLGGMHVDEDVVEKACKTWLDVRAFGQVFAFKARKSKKEPEGTGHKGVSIGIRGPVTVHSAYSVSPVNLISTYITKSVTSDGDESRRGPDTIGVKYRVDCGIYTFFGSMNPQLAVKTGFSDEDANAIKAVLPRLFENDASSARPEGSIEVLKVVWWEHSCARGQCSSAKLHRSINVCDTDNLDALLKIEKSIGPFPEIIDGV